MYQGGVRGNVISTMLAAQLIYFVCAIIIYSQLLISLSVYSFIVLLESHLGLYSLRTFHPLLYVCASHH